MSEPCHRVPDAEYKMLSGLDAICASIVQIALRYFREDCTLLRERDNMFASGNSYGHTSTRPYSDLRLFTGFMDAAFSD